MNDLKNEFTITRVFNAPRDLVFQLWTDPLHLSKWFGPTGSTINSFKMDFRVGGIFLYNMKIQNGLEMWGKWHFQEILPPEKIIFIQSFSDSKGNIVKNPMTENWPLEVFSTIVFKEANGKTTLEIKWLPIHATETELEVFYSAFGNMQMGWSGTFDRLEDYLKNI